MKAKTGQYHWTLDESVLYFGESENTSKTSPMSSDIGWLTIQ